MQIEFRLRDKRAKDKSAPGFLTFNATSIVLSATVVSQLDVPSFGCS